MCGYVESSRDSRECREDVDDEYWAVEGHDDSGYPGSNTANRGHHDQDSFPASPIRQRRREGRHHRRRHHAQQCHQPNRGRAPGPEGDDSKCHGQSPLSSPGSEEAQLSTAQICRSQHCSRTPMRPPSTCCAAVGSSPATITLGTVTALCVRALRGKAYAARSHQDQEGELIFSRVLSDHRRIKINFCNALGSRVEGSRPVAGSRFWAQKSS
jgi:hypothetical protein